jgi:hypothetical protein
MQVKPASLGIGEGTLLAAQQGSGRPETGNMGVSDSIMGYPLVVNGLSAHMAFPSFADQTLFQIPNSHHTIIEQSLRDVAREFDSLTNELSALDRYMAINTFKLDSEVKKTLVEQRKALVRDLDTARHYREHLQEEWKQQAGGLNITGPITLPNWQPSYSNLMSAYGATVLSTPTLAWAFQPPGDRTSFVPVTSGGVSDFSSINETYANSTPVSFPISTGVATTSPMWAYANAPDFVPTSVEAKEIPGQLSVAQFDAMTSQLAQSTLTDPHGYDPGSQIAHHPRSEMNDLEQMPKSDQSAIGLRQEPQKSMMTASGLASDSKLSVGPKKPKERRSSRSSVTVPHTKHQRKKASVTIAADNSNKPADPVEKKVLSDSGSASNNSAIPNVQA